jgi:hypothetical protein
MLLIVNKLFENTEQTIKTRTDSNLNVYNNINDK